MQQGGINTTEYFCFFVCLLDRGRFNEHDIGLFTVLLLITPKWSLRNKQFSYLLFIILIVACVSPEEESNGAGTCMAANGGTDIVDFNLAVQIGESFFHHFCNSGGVFITIGL